MKNFNLLLSTSRFNEENAKAEIWFILLMCNDEYPVISSLEFPGLISALSNLNSREIIAEIKEILKNDPNFLQYILKILPIDFVCETNIKTINQIIQKHYKEFIKENDSFKIVLKRRKNKLFERNNFIDLIAKEIDNKVDLENPNKLIVIEVLGNVCGISFITPEDILSLPNPQNSLDSIED